MEKISLYGMLSIFILVILGLSLTGTVSDSAQAIVQNNNSSDILVMIAPYADVIWIVGIFSIIALIGVGIAKEEGII